MITSFTSITEIETYLLSIPKFSTGGSSAANFNLNRMIEFCSVMGNPQEMYSTIHVAGTNGKGTVCRMFTSVYQEGGYKTGLYTSPHLRKVQERFLVDGIEISNDKLIGFFRKFGTHIQESAYTFFEITTAIAFWYFAQEEVDIAIIETGLGGRLDATNVLKSDLSVITSIGMDHTDLLGNTLASIAFEKGGIIKKYRPVVIGQLPKEAEDKLVEIAQNLDSELIRASDLAPRIDNRRIQLDIAGSKINLEYPGKRIDAVNSAIVCRGVKQLEEKFPVSLHSIISGIENMQNRYPNTAVFEKLHPGKMWYFDGAHNPDATGQLIEHLLNIAPAESWTVVVSFMKDKLTDDTTRSWNAFPNLFVWQMDGERAASTAEMIHCFPHARFIEASGENPVNLFETELVIFSGSFYFYEVVSNWMGTKTNSL